MPTNVWVGGESANAGEAGNWSEGLPEADQDIIVPSYATYGITSGMTAISGIALKSFWVQDGFSGNIGNNSGGFLQIDISGSGASQFLYEGNSTTAKFHFVKTLDTVPIEIRKTGVGNTGQPAFQMITNDVSSPSTNMGIVSIYSGEVYLGPEMKSCELGGVVVGSNGGQSSPVVMMGVGCRSEAADAILPFVTVNHGYVDLQTGVDDLNHYGGETNLSGGSVADLNLYGGTVKLNNPTGAAGGNVIVKLNLRGGVFDNTENPTQKTITNADLHSGTIRDPAGELTWTNPVVYKNKMTDVTADFGPERTVTIA